MAKKISKHISYAEAVRTSVDMDNNPNEGQLANMQHLAEKVFEPTREALGGNPIRVNSFFRSIEVNRAIGGSLRSQHRHGCAIDLDAIKSTNAEIFFYIFDNLEFDQLIWEKGDKEQPDWVHVSLVRQGTNRKQALIYRNGKYLTFFEGMLVRPEVKKPSEDKPKAKRGRPKKAVEVKPTAKRGRPKKSKDEKAKKK